MLIAAEPKLRLSFDRSTTAKESSFPIALPNHE